MAIARLPIRARNKKNQIHPVLREGEAIPESNNSASRTREGGNTNIRIQLDERLGEFGLGDNDDAAFSDREAALAIVFEIVTDGRTLRNLHVFINDSTTDSTMAADVDAVEKYRIIDGGGAVDAQPMRQYAAPDGACADDAPLDVLSQIVVDILSRRVVEKELVHGWVHDNINSQRLQSQPRRIGDGGRIDRLFLKAGPPILGVGLLDVKVEAVSDPHGHA